MIVKINNANNSIAPNKYVPLEFVNIKPITETPRIDKIIAEIPTLGDFIKA